MAQSYQYNNNTIYGTLSIAENTPESVLVTLFKVESDGSLTHVDHNITNEYGTWTFIITESYYYTIKFHGGGATEDDWIKAIYLDYDQGSTGIRWRGNWGLDVNYYVNDVVYYNSSSFICTGAHVSESSGTNGPPQTGSYWQEFASGSTAKNVKLISSSQIFTFNGLNQPSPSGQEIEFTVLQSNTENPTTWTTDPIVTLTDQTDSGAKLSIGNFGANNSVKVRIDREVVYDEITVHKISDGSDGATGTSITGFLTNESHVVQADSLGTVTTYDGAGGIFKVYEGLTDITGSGPAYSVVSYTGSWDTQPDTDATIGINSSTGAYSISGLTSEMGTITFRAVYSTVTIDKVYTLSKSIAGQEGPAGSDAKVINLTTSSQTFTYDGAGVATPPSQTINFEASLSNISGNITWQTLGDASSPILTGYGTKNKNADLSVGDFGNNTKLKVTASADGYSDFITIHRLSSGIQGENSVVGLLTNEAHVAQADSSGSVGDWTTAGGEFKVFDGLLDVTDQCSFSINSFAGTWSPSPTEDPAGDNPGIISGPGPTGGQYQISGLSSQQGFIDFQANYKGKEIVKRYSISKSIDGLDGQDAAFWDWVTSEFVTVTGNRVITRSGGVDGWTQGAYTRVGYAKGAIISWKFDDKNGFAGYCGLDNSPNFDTSIQFAWLVQTNGQATVRINGSIPSGAPSYELVDSDNVLTVEYDGATAKWYIDGVLKYADTSLESDNTFYASTLLWSDETHSIEILEFAPKGTSSVTYYIKALDGTAIKNSVGTLEIEAHKINGTVDSILSSGSIQLYEGFSPIGFSKNYNAADINDSIVVTLSDGTNTYDSITLVDVTDGANGSDAIVGFIEPIQSLAWIKNGLGEWTPSGNTNILVIRFWQGGQNLSTGNAHISLNETTGLLYQSYEDDDNGALSISYSGDNERSITVTATYGTVSVSETVYSIFDGEDATNVRTKIWEWSGSKAWPTTGDIADADTYDFESDYTGNAVVRIQAYDAEGNVYAALNGVQIGVLSGANNETKWYEFEASNLIQGKNTFAIWADLVPLDTGNYYEIEVWVILDGSQQTSYFSDGSLTDEATNPSVRSAAFGSTRINFNNGSMFLPFTVGLRSSTGYSPATSPNSVASFRKDEGRLGSGIAIEASTTNLLHDPGVWEGSQNWNVWQWNSPSYWQNRNDVEKNTQNENWGNVWTGIATNRSSLAMYAHGVTTISLSVTAGTQYTFSCYVSTNFPGEYRLRPELTTSRGSRICDVVYSEYQYLDETFKRFEVTVTCDTSNNDAGFTMWLYSKDNTLLNGYKYSWAFPQLEQKSYATSFTSIDRSNPNLEYNFTKPTQNMTLVWWTKFHQNSSTQGTSHLFHIYNTENSSNYLRFRRFNNGKLLISGSGGLGDIYSDETIDDSAGTWTMWSATFDGENDLLNIFKNDLKVYSNSKDISTLMKDVLSQCDRIRFHAESPTSNADVSNALWDNFVYIRGVALPDKDIKVFYENTAPIEDVENVFPRIQVRNGGSESIIVGEFGSDQITIQNNGIFHSTPNFGVFPFLAGFSWMQIPYSATTGEVVGGIRVQNLINTTQLLDITYTNPESVGTRPTEAIVDLSPLGYYNIKPEPLIIPSNILYYASGTDRMVLTASTEKKGLGNMELSLAYFLGKSEQTVEWDYTAGVGDILHAWPDPENQLVSSTLAGSISSETIHKVYIEKDNKIVTGKFRIFFKYEIQNSSA
jgi:hypothetical protein